LTRAVIGDLTTAGTGQPPGRLIATGWEIGDLYGALRIDGRTAHRWLETAPPDNTSTQPWHAGATVYDRNGQPADARRLRLAAANKVTKHSPCPSKIARTLYL
jgi:hypothetical protein